MEFKNKVFKAEGYKDVAKRTGVPRAWRAVGSILNPDSSSVGFNRKKKEKEELLRRKKNKRFKY